MHTIKIICSFGSFIRIAIFTLLAIIAMTLWIHAEIKCYETKVEQKWMNYYYEKIIEYDNVSRLHEPVFRDEWDEYR